MSFADRFSYLPAHPFYRERLQQLIQVSTADRIAEFLQLLPRIESFYDLRFFHDCLCHVVDHLDQSGEQVSLEHWEYLCQAGPSNCLSLESVEKLLRNAAIWTEARGVAATWLARAWRRHAFQRQLVKKGLTESPPIALGLQCLPWTLPGRWGFRTGCHAIPTFTPLAVGHHHPDAILQLLHEGLSAYAPESLRSVRSANGVVLTGRADARVLWNHHIGAHWHENGFDFFRFRIGKLIRSFDQMLANPPFRPLRFIIQYRTDSVSDFTSTVNRVEQALAGRVSVPFILIAVNDAWREPNQIVLTPPDPERPHIRLIFAPPPSRTYVWHLPASWDSDAGEAYEFAVAKVLREAMCAATGDKHQIPQ